MGFNSGFKGLNWILEKQAGRPWTELEFLEVVDYLRNCHLPKQDYAPAT